MMLDSWTSDESIGECTMNFSTKAIHAGQEPDPTTGAVSVPIYQTSTYARKALVNTRGSNTREHRIRRGLRWRKPSRRSNPDAHALHLLPVWPPPTRS